MSSYDKVVKLACKPKAAPPKAKYLDPIIAATWSEDGAIHDVCKALSPRFREPNAIVVFKALIVLHTMIRNGATDNVLSYLSSADVLRLRNVAHGQWEGYDTPQNLAHYAFYLDSRVRAYRELKHDAVRVQSESNRDMRVSQSIEDSRVVSGVGGGSGSGPQRSKTIMGRKLRSMTVEKGLLRETKAVHRMIDALVECKFYLDDLEDELTITALRMLVKDLLVLFQAGNEGVINVLEHYFEMSHVDAEQALAIYRHFCKQTEHVVEYLAVARKLENLLNVPIPNLKHAPVSLAGALEEYLKDPNFEKNRVEYKANKAAVDRNSAAPLKSTLKKNPKTPPSPSAVPPVPKSDAASGPSASKPETNQAMVDFFASIDTEQENMFNSNAASTSSQSTQNQVTFNPFLQRQSMAITSQTGGAFAHQQQPLIQSQATGFILPQHTAFQVPPFPTQQQQQQTSSSYLQPPQQQTVSPFQQSQQSAFIQPQTFGFLQPQATGSNPFRQSTLFPQSMGTTPFASGGNVFGGGPGQSASVPLQPLSAQGASFTGISNAFQQPPSNATNVNSPFAINRPQSTPITSQVPSQPLTAVVTHQTGSKNPFGVPVAPTPPVPKPPTLQALATGAFRGSSNTFDNGFANGPLGSIQDQRPSLPKFSSQPTGSAMASVASSFATKSDTPNIARSQSNPFPKLASQDTATTTNFSELSSLSSNPTGSTSPTTAHSISSLQPQQTGFGGVKPFKPSSSFGANLLESLPPIAGSPPKSSTSLVGVQSTAHPGLQASNGHTLPFHTTGGGMFNGQISTSGALNAQPTNMPSFPVTTNGNAGGLPTTGGLRPQMTGGVNPFRMSMMAPPSVASSFGTPPFQSSTSSVPGLPQGASFTNLTGTNPMAAKAFGTMNQSPFSLSLSHQDTSLPQNGSLI
ncbi:ANTH-domain-containing protein [Ramaria rubella]|nr:ANTH-domain-containing protein [Ramaria rubella]